MPSVITASDLRAILGVGATVSDATLDAIIDAAEGALLPYLKPTDAEGVAIDYSTVPPVCEAIRHASIDVFKMRTAPGGNYNGVDFSPSPWQLGRQYFERFEGMLAPWLDVRSVLG